MSIVDWFVAGTNAALNSPVIDDSPFDWSYIRMVYQEALWKSGQVRSLSTYRDFLKGYRHGSEMVTGWHENNREQSS